MNSKKTGWILWNSSFKWNISWWLTVAIFTAIFDLILVWICHKRGKLWQIHPQVQYILQWFRNCTKREMCLGDGMENEHQGIEYIRERLPYWLSCDVRAHKFHVKNLVFKDHCLSDHWAWSAPWNNNRALWSVTVSNMRLGVTAKISGTAIKSQSTTLPFSTEGSVRYSKNPQYSK